MGSMFSSRRILVKVLSLALLLQLAHGSGAKIGDGDRVLDKVRNVVCIETDEGGVWCFPVAVSYNRKSKEYVFMKIQDLPTNPGPQSNKRSLKDRLLQFTRAQNCAHLVKGEEWFCLPEDLYFINPVRKEY